MRDFWYGLSGICVLFGAAGAAEAITGRGSFGWGITIVIVGAGFGLIGWTYDHFRNYN